MMNIEKAEILIEALKKQGIEAHIYNFNGAIYICFEKYIIYFDDYSIADESDLRYGTIRFYKNKELIFTINNLNMKRG